MASVFMSGRGEGVLQTLILPPGIFILSFIFPFVFLSILFVSGRAWLPTGRDSLFFCIVAKQLLLLFAFYSFCQFALGRLEVRSSEVSKFASKTHRKRLWAHGEGNETMGNSNQHPLTRNQPVKSWWREGNPFLVQNTRSLMLVQIVKSSQNRPVDKLCKQC